MAATRRRSKRDLHVVITESDGTVTSLLVARGGFNQIRKNPITGLGQVVTTGDNAARSDQRTPQVILSDQTGGMGEFFYTETEGISTFTDSECDTRYPGMVVLPPAATRLGAAGAIAALATIAATPYRAWWLNEANARWLVGGPSVIGVVYNPAAGTWSAPLGGTMVKDLARFQGRYLVATGASIFSSTNGATWAALAGSPAAVDGICTHDNKVFAADSSGVAYVLRFTTDVTGAWTASATFQPARNEAIYQLIEWRDRVGRAVVYVVTNQRILQYDEDADTFLQFYQYPTLGDTSTQSLFPWAFVGPGDGNLYVALANRITDTSAGRLVWFAGTTNLTGPNDRGGLPSGTAPINLGSIAGGTIWTYVSTWQRTGATVAGKVFSLNDQQGWGTLATGVSAATGVHGLGYGGGYLLYITYDGSAYELIVPDERTSPLHAAIGARTYDTTATRYHEYAFTDGGTPLMNKQWLWITVQCLDHVSANKVPGLNANTSVVVQYRRDVDTAWTTLGTLTSASTFPAVLPIASGFGVKAKQIKVRLGLASSNSGNTPVVTSVALAYVRQEVPRYAYTVPIDLSDRTHPLYRGKSMAGLLAAMDRWTQPGALVKLQFAGGDAATSPSTGTTVQNATFAYSGAEDAERGPGTYSAIFADFTPGSSG